MTRSLLVEKKARSKKNESTESISIKGLEIDQVHPKRKISSFEEIGDSRKISFGTTTVNMKTVTSKISEKDSEGFTSESESSSDESSMKSSSWTSSED